MNKLHLVTIILLIILIGAFTNWLLTSFETKPLISPREIRHDPDYFLENFTATLMNEAGLARYKLIANRLEHFPDDDSIVIQQLTLHLYRNQLPEWTARADQGVVYDKGKRIELTNQVRLHRPATPENAEITLLTRDLTIYPQREYAETGSAVTITSGRNEIQAVGMRLDLSNGRLELLSETKGKYVITPR